MKRLCGYLAYLDADARSHWKALGEELNAVRKNESEKNAQLKIKERVGDSSTPKSA